MVRGKTKKILIEKIFWTHNCPPFIPLKFKIKIMNDGTQIRKCHITRRYFLVSYFPISRSPSLDMDYAGKNLAAFFTSADVKIDVT